MPGKIDRSRKKVNHKARNRRVAGFHEIEARNEGTWVDFSKRRKPGEEGEEGEEDEEEQGESSEEEQEKENEGPKVYKKEKSTGIYPEGFQRGLLNRNMGDDDEEAAPQITRKQREEMEKERKRRAYEEKHKRGETDEAKADLERLQKIRAERDAAKANRDAEKTKKEDEEKAKKKKDQEYIDALGGAKAGPKSVKRKMGNTADQMDDFQDQKKAETIDPVNALAGSIDACRLEEEDFM